MTAAWTGRLVLVTGGTGFIGSFVVEELLRRGARVRVPTREGNAGRLEAHRSAIEWVEGDLEREEDCVRFVDGVEEVFHLASLRKNVAYHRAHPSEVAAANVRMMLALLEALKVSGQSVPLTFFSSANVPPALDTVALAGGENVDGYVLGKALCTALCLTAAHQRGFPLLIPCPVGVYGPRDTFREDGNVIPALMVKARAATDALTVWGDGSQSRAFLYVDDLVRAVFLLRDGGVQGVHYIAPGEEVTIREIAERIRDLVRPGLPVTFDAGKPAGAQSIALPPMHEVLRDMHWTPLREGLERTLRSSAIL